MPRLEKTRVLAQTTTRGERFVEFTMPVDLPEAVKISTVGDVTTLQGRGAASVFVTLEVDDGGTWRHVLTFGRESAKYTAPVDRPDEMPSITVGPLSKRLSGKRCRVFVRTDKNVSIGLEVESV